MQTVLSYVFLQVELVCKHCGPFKEELRLVIITV